MIIIIAIIIIKKTPSSLTCESDPITSPVSISSSNFFPIIHATQMRDAAPAAATEPPTLMRSGMLELKAFVTKDPPAFDIRAPNISIQDCGKRTSTTSLVHVYGVWVLVGVLL